MELFRFEVFTPYRLFFADMVEFVSMTLIDGDIGVLAHHSSMTAPVKSGILRIKTKDGIARNAFISSGIIEITEIKTVLMADTAEWPEEIDTERAITAGAEARKSLEAAKLKFESEQAKAKIRRSEFRLKVAKMG